LLFANLAVGSPSASLHPYDNGQNLRFTGNFTATGVYNGTVRNTTGTIATTFTPQGSNAGSQTLSGSGDIITHDFVMNRQGGGTGTVRVQRNITVRNVLDLQESGNPNPQILELGVNADFTLTNAVPTAILNAPVSSETEIRAVRTSTQSGRLFRAVAAAGSYLFPVSSVGSSVSPQTTYTPLRYEVPAVPPASGQFGVRVSVGGNTAQTGAHKQLPSGLQNASSSYARRVWSCIGLGAGGFGRLSVEIPSDVQGSRAVLQLARYRPSEEIAGGAWLYADMAAEQGASEFSGDWTFLERLSRTFYSRASGLWTDSGVWSFVSHRGEAVPNGVFPSRLTDSVIVGGGTNGIENHVVTLRENASVSGILVGTSATNTGTLECAGEAWTGGQTFALGERSTLRTGAARGIQALPVADGSIRAVGVRRFPPNAQYDYIGTTNQEYGTALPANVDVLRVAKPSATRLTADRSIGLWSALLLESGTLDVQTFTLRNTTTATASGGRLCLLGTTATLRIAGTNGFADASTGTVSGFPAYNLNAQSIVDFYGTTQVVEPIPFGVNYGNVIVRGGAKAIWNALIVRGDIRVLDNANFVNWSNGEGLRVFGTFHNSANTLNNGVIDIGVGQ
jgi:hypothetical protein